MDTKKKTPTLGSLFDGSGGFPLGGLVNGITPVWASEIEPFPIRVTTKRLPDMKHYGNINTINGADLPPVDIITFGSPCTDLSVAGQRAGLGGEKSSLFFQAIRVIKEMRRATNEQYPRFVVWENVPGAYSSGKGGDFRCVLEEIVRIKDETASVPLPAKGKWLPAGEIRGCASALGDGFSIAYRTLDAQYWGVPQRRRRIYLVADFGGVSAGRVLFESESLYRNPSPFGGARQAAPFGAETGTGDASRTHYGVVSKGNGDCFISHERHTALTGGGGQAGQGYPCTLEVNEAKAVSFKPGAIRRFGGGHHDVELSGTLLAHMGDNQMCVAIENHPADSRVNVDDSGTIQTLTGRMGTGGGNVPMVMNERQLSMQIEENVANTLIGTDYKGPQCVFEPATLKIRAGCKGGGKGPLVQKNKSVTLGCHNDQTLFVPSAAYSIQGNMIGRKDKNGPNGIGVTEDVAYTLNTTDRHGVFFESGFAGYGEGTYGTLRRKGGTVGDGSESLVAGAHTVRRLTPLEGCRLQGFPDFWCADLETENPTDDEVGWWSEVFETHRKTMGTSEKPKSRKQIIKWLKNPYSDSAEYKMWGNGVALPCVAFVLCDIAHELRNEKGVETNENSN